MRVPRALPPSPSPRAPRRPRRLPSVLLALLLALLGGPSPSASGEEPAPPAPAPAPAPAPEPPPAPVPGPTRYGETPERLAPYAGGEEPARRFFTEPPAFRGPEHVPDPADKGPVRIGVIAPTQGADAVAGQHLREGLALALDEANAAGGYAPGRPFELVQREEADTWGAAGNAMVDLMRGPGVVAIVGAFEDAQTHILTRLVLKLEVPLLNTAGPDPTLTEHNIPWLVRLRPDDRQTCYALARRIFVQDQRRRVVVFRSNDRYGRTGVRELVDAARRLHHPILLEQRFEAREQDLSRQVEALRALQPDAVVLWGRPAATGRALRQLRALGVNAPVYGPDRLVDPAFVEAAGPAALGAVLAYPFHPGRTDARWVAFRTAYRARFGAEPGATAAYAYDGLRYLIDAVRRVGPSRTAVLRELFAAPSYEGVTGTCRFDVNHNNVSPVVLGTLRQDGFHPDTPPEPAAPPAEVVVGLLLPAHAEGARDLADGLAYGLEAEAARAPAGPRVVVRTAAAHGAWDALARGAGDLVTRQRAVVLVAPPGREEAHLAAQVATRLSTPLLSTSPAASVTGTGTTWALRVVPGAPAPAAPVPSSPSDAAPAPAASPPFLPEPFVPAGEAGRAFVEGFTRRFGRAPSTWAAAAHDAARALAAALRAATEPSGADALSASRGTRLRDAFAGLRGLPGAQGPFDLDERGSRVR